MALDIATTGNRYGIDRILSAAVCTTGGTRRSWLVDPGPGPLSVAPYKGHNITVEQARAEGTPATEALGELATILTEYLATKEPLVAWYSPFVLTTLETELTRHGLAPLSTRLPGGLSPVCDPLVLDRHAEPYRSGVRRLENVAEWYGIHHDDPSNPASDAETSLVLAQVIAACHPAVGRLSRPALHREQVRWHDRFVRELEARRPGIATDRHWPMETVHVSDWTDHSPN
ncbi:3'-5' exonuclease [Streptomyces sp. NPDC102360]|uniref:3'-5' exonuclease n=1 Tax=Streptomyces sp. NPDC102360 TaxID=3366160 RepID=UPI003822478B